MLRKQSNPYVSYELLELIPQKDSKKYVIAMDNYFTLPSFMESTRSAGVAVVGTARNRRGWPPTEYKEVNYDQFTSVYCINDNQNFRIIRWVDNNVVNMVTTLHTEPNQYNILERSLD
jgi:hypothetical protein